MKSSLISFKWCVFGTLQVRLPIRRQAVTGWFSVVMFTIQFAPTNTGVFHLTNAIAALYLDVQGTRHVLDGNYDLTGTGIDGAVATSLPLTLPLFATGLAGMGLFGWRRKRKVRAALAAA